MTNQVRSQVAAVLVSLACAGGWALAQTEVKGAQIDETKLEKRTSKVQCLGNQTVSLVGVSLRLQDVASEAAGGCKVIIRNSHVSGAVAIQLVGPGDVTVENSIIEGTTNWIQMSGSATVSVKSSTIRGGTQRVGGAKLSDLGGNDWK